MILSAASEHKEAVILSAQKHGVPIVQIGKVFAGELVIGDRIKLSVKEIQSIYENAIPKRMNL